MHDAHRPMWLSREKMMGIGRHDVPNMARTYPARSGAEPPTFVGQNGEVLRTYGVECLSYFLSIATSAYFCASCTLSCSTVHCLAML